MKEKEKSAPGLGKVIARTVQRGKEPSAQGVLLSASGAEGPVELTVKSSPCCWHLKDFEDQGMFWLFPSWPS